MIARQISLSFKFIFDYIVLQLLIGISSLPGYFSYSSLMPLATEISIEEQALVYNVLHWYLTSMLCSIDIDICKNKVFADHFHVTISQAQRTHIRPFCFTLTSDRVLVFDWVVGFMSPPSWSKVFPLLCGKNMKHSLRNNTWHGWYKWLLRKVNHIRF